MAKQKPRDTLKGTFAHGQNVTWWLNLAIFPVNMEHGKGKEEVAECTS